jgi:alkanesulfonate monooxygenase SsuD/methylene tetrahydromethanopterin reductase-like flavin-dependent oxidoreductase (luciferase family)
MVAAVGPKMTSVAAEVCNVQIHSFTTERYLREVTTPTVGATGRFRKDFTVSFPGLVATGDSDTMTGLVDDDVLSTIAIVAEPEDVGAEIVRRFAGLVDRFTLSTPYPLDEDTRATLVAGIKAGS